MGDNPYEVLPGASGVDIEADEKIVDSARTSLMLAKVGAWHLSAAVLGGVAAGIAIGQRVSSSIRAGLLVLDVVLALGAFLYPFIGIVYGLFWLLNTRGLWMHKVYRRTVIVGIMVNGLLLGSEGIFVMLVEAASRR